MSEVEKAVAGWTKARLRLAACLLDSNSALNRMQLTREEWDARMELLRVGTKLLVDSGENFYPGGTK